MFWVFFSVNLFKTRARSSTDQPPLGFLETGNMNLAYELISNCVDLLLFVQKRLCHLRSQPDRLTAVPET